MTRQTFSTVSTGAVVAEIDVDEARSLGAGGVAYPRLCVPACLHLRGVRGTGPADLAFTDLFAQLWIAQDVDRIADALPLKIHTIGSVAWHQALDESFYLEFPLDAVRVAQLERLRNGGDLTFRLDLKLSAQEFGPPHEAKEDAPVRCTLRRLHRLTAQLVFTVPKSVWIEQVLPRLGYGMVHIIEFPAASLDSCAELAQSFQALHQAQELHKLGLYDDAVGKCRVALDKFFELADKTGEDGAKRRVPILKRSWEAKLGKDTYTWLDGTLGAIKQAANLAHHSPNAHYSQLDSQMILAITSAVVSYAARTRESEAVS